MEKSELITADAAAQELATTPMRVLMLIKRQSLQGEMIDDEWHVLRKSLDYFKTQASDGADEAGCRISCTASGCHCSSKG